MSKMSKELKDFIKWCDEYCYIHQGSASYAQKHKTCRQCWNKILKDASND